MPGYPDWQATPEWRGDPLFAQQGFATAALPFTHTPYTGNLQNYAYLTLGGVFNTRNGQLQVASSDTAGSGQTYLMNFSVLAAQQFLYQVPILFENVAVNVGSNGGAATVDLYVSATNVPVIPGTVGGDGVISFTTSGAIASLGVYDVTLPPYTGPARVVVDSTQQNFNIRLRGLLYDNATIQCEPLAAVEGAQNLNYYDVWLPPYINHVRVGNLNAAAATFTVSVTAQNYSGLPG